jgi:hypothetical protein
MDLARLHNHPLYTSFSFLFTPAYINILKTSKARTDEQVVNKLVDILDYIKDHDIYNIHFTDDERIEFGNSFQFITNQDDKLIVVSNKLSDRPSNIDRYLKFSAQTYINLYKENPGYDQIVLFFYVPTILRLTEMLKISKHGNDQNIRLFPDRAHKLYVITDSKVSNALFNIAKRFLHERTLQKLQVITSAEAEKILTTQYQKISVAM